MIRVLLVDDSVTQREILKRVLEADGAFTVVAEARDGREGIARVREHSPDVVLMDIHMPDMDGVEATREIMRRNPVPIVIASASLRQRDVDLGLEALRAGAVSVVDKPQGAVLLHLQEIAPALKSELIAASRARVWRRPALETGSPRAESAASRETHVIGVCASTGGPPVLLKMLSQLPPAYPIPILLVQHIPDGFVAGFARWLGEQSGQRVELASSGQRLEPGVWLSPGGRHLEMGDHRRILLTEPAAGDLHCPSGDMLLSSLARQAALNAIGIVLTGMGADGAAGLLALRQAGGRTIAQDETSSLIFGMPRAARDNGAADLELPPDEIVRIMVEAAPAGTSNKA